MSDYYLSDLGEETEFADADLFHFRNNAGIDKKITGENMTTEVLTFVNHVRRTEFVITGAGWYTLFRTQDNFQGLIKVSAYGSSVRDYVTFSVYGDEDAGESNITVVEQSRRGTINGIERVRWGDAGAGNGMCLQAYVNPATDTDCRIRATSWGAQPADNNPGLGFVFETAPVNNQTDFDGNTVTFNRTYYRAALGELIKANQYRYVAGDITKSGGTLEPGVYRNVTITGNCNFRSGKFVFLGDLTIGSGVTVTCRGGLDYQMGVEYTGTTFKPATRPWQPAVPDVGSYIGAATSRFPRIGGGKGAAGQGSQIGGGDGPCMKGGFFTTDEGGTGGGFLFLNIVGKFVNNGVFNCSGANGSATSGTRGTGGGAGGLIVLRALDIGFIGGTMNCSGGDGGNDTNDGGGGGGGVIETYTFGVLSVSTNVTAGSRGATSAQAGSVFKINLLNQPDKVNGGSDVVTNDEYLHAGVAIRDEGGWWV